MKVELPDGENEDIEEDMDFYLSSASSRRKVGRALLGLALA